MKFRHLAARARHAGAGSVLALALVVPWTGWAADVFDFVPAGGRTLLSRALAGRPVDAEVNALLTGKRSRDEWQAYLGGHGSVIKGLQGFDAKQLLTLADYLAHNMPLAAFKPPAKVSQVDWEKALPGDGRDFALRYCQGCHIITVVVTQSRTRDAWLGTMGKPSHVQIKLQPAQRAALADYLVINGGIPIDDVPEELRAGGATY
jgi:mono/diheme cytochrome c family protein